MIFLLFILFSSFAFSLDFFPLNELKEGMMGEVKTCLKGTEPKIYPVEIKGVLKGLTEKDFIILGKIISPEFENTGIIAGMSGSPVFIEGKLLGALAYAWSFSKEPLCGITYWRNMVDLKAEGLKNVSYLKEEELTLSLDEISFKLKEEFERIVKNLNHLNLQAYPFQENNFSIFEGGIVQKDIKYPLEGGFPIAGMLAWGDFNLFASGTITFKDKENLYAFGHPFLDLGKIEIPFARAYPELVVSSIYRSFRLSNGGEIIGTIEVDGKDGVVGKVGRMPKGVKVLVNFKEKGKKFFVVNHPLLLPVLSGLGTSSLFYEEKTDMGSGSILMELSLYGKDKISKKFFFESEDLFSDIYSRVSSILALFTLNPFQDFNINSVEINFKEIKEKNKFNILKVLVDKRKLKMEKELNLDIFLEDYLGKKENIKKIIKVSSSESFDLYIGASKEIEKILRKEQAVFFKNFDDFKKAIIEKPEEGKLFIYIKTQISSLSNSIYSFKKVSPSFLIKFPEISKKNYGIFKLEEVELSYPIEGFYEIKIEGEK